jgi:cellulose synthase/poly-beta-1,6-N-acetylglucosamine synthase-like glycosyltransferase
MAKSIFWLSFIVIVYVWVGYPLLLMLWRKLRRRPIEKIYHEPSVSIVIAMHNESEYANAKIQNCLELDYPPDKLQVIVSLDAPTDGTEQLVRQYFSRGVDIVYSSVRRGKAAAINNGVAMASGDLVLFGDARQRFETGIVRELVANFADPSVGAASGELRILNHEGRESAYWRFEKKLRALESDIHSLPGATGAIYAIRRSMFVPLSPNTVLDDVVIPMRIVLAGKRSIFDPSAHAYDAASETPQQEFEKKRRTLAGNYQLLGELPELLHPWRNPIFLQFVSHKIGRLVVPYCLIALFVSNCFLLEGFYRLTLAGQLLWYAAALAGSLISNRGNAIDPAVSAQEAAGRT